MKQAFAFSRSEWLDTIDSTNDELKRRLRAQVAGSGDVLAAGIQTGGKGRMGRTWVSPAGVGLYFSFIWEGVVPLNEAGTLPMACALGIRDFLKIYQVDSVCKWPNDVLTERGKICGILAESMLRPDGTACLVIGLGINIRPDPVRDSQISQPVATLADFHPTIPEPIALLPEVLACLEQRVRVWLREGFSGICQDLELCLWGKGKSATVRTRTGRITGVIEGLREGGALLLRLPDSTLYSVVSAAALDEDNAVPGI